MTHRLCIVSGCLLGLMVSPAFAQFGDVTLSTFGYFQVSFQHQESTLEEDTDNSFNVQQLNLFFQTDFTPRWRGFVNFEVLNNFSSSQGWGSFDLDEAWVRYRANQHFILRAGLQVPKFNRLNEIKNRTPLLPYVVRPLVYEESFSEFFNIEEFVPERAFLQLEGWFPVTAVKLDYAVYLGNSPNVNSQFDNTRNETSQQTGVDTTTTVLVGGRVGLRYGELELGVSATRETTNDFSVLAEAEADDRPFIEGIAPNELSAIPKTRLGVDLSYQLGGFFLEGEYIAVRNDVDLPKRLATRDGPPRLGLDRTFYYATLSYPITERLLAYGSYWYSTERFLVEVLSRSYHEEVNVQVFTGGVRYALLQDADGFDRITLKAQYAFAEIDEDVDVTVSVVNLEQDNHLHVFGVAVSVLF